MVAVGAGRASVLEALPGRAPLVFFQFGGGAPAPGGSACASFRRVPRKVWTERSVELVFAHFDVLGMPKTVSDELYSKPVILAERPDIESAFRGVDNRDWFATPELATSRAVEAVVPTPAWARRWSPFQRTQ